MKRSVTIKASYRPWLWAGIGCALTVIPLSAQAQTEGFAVQQFLPEPDSAINYNHVQGANTAGHLIPAFGFYIHYAHRPATLTIVDDSGNVTESADLIARQIQADVMAVLGIGSRFDLGLALPVTLNQVAGESTNSITVPSLEPRVLGDLRIVPKIRLLGSGLGPNLALAVPISLPTGDEANLQGNAGVTVTPKAIFDLHLTPRIKAAVNLGYILRPEQSYEGLTIGNELAYGAALALSPVPGRLQFTLETFGRRSMDSNVEGGTQNAPLELDLSARFTPILGHHLTIGGGPGLSQGYGTPDFRVFVGYTFVPPPPPPPPVDSDGDGLLDLEDTCPQRPEDKDGFQDEDGCPDPDNDRDGIEDRSDTCPVEAEDKDGFQDEDGCPDPDNDGDGFKDKEDQCPSKAEDKDGFQDEDGCPDPDNDGDGLLDPDDQCPNEAEVINGVKDDDGCPDEGEPAARLTPKSIEIMERVYFDFNQDTIQERSYNVLNQVASILKANKQITLIRIDGHADPVGSEEYNRALSLRRAEAVKAYLVKRGIDARRLATKAFGESESAGVERPRAKDRRVEFTILEINGKPLPNPK